MPVSRLVEIIFLFCDPAFRATSIIGWVLDAIFSQKTGRQGLNEGVAVPPPQIYFYFGSAS
jgi:hypothetical protein